MATKTKMVKIRVTEAEEKHYKKVAAEAGISVSELIRRTMRNRPPVVILGGLEELRKSLGTITKIGNLQKKVDEVMYKTQMANDVSPDTKQRIINSGFKKLIEERQKLTPEIIQLKKVLLELLERIQ